MGHNCVRDRLSLLYCLTAELTEQPSSAVAACTIIVSPRKACRSSGLQNLACSVHSHPTPQHGCSIVGRHARAHASC